MQGKAEGSVLCVAREGGASRQGLSGSERKRLHREREGQEGLAGTRRVLGTL